MRDWGVETLIIDNEKESRAVAYDALLRNSLPGLQESFEQVDHIYENDKEAALGRLVENRFTVRLTGKGEPIEASVIIDDESAMSDQAMLIFAPFSDVAPQTSADTIMDYISKEAPGFLDINRAKPHSWNQSTKSAAIHDLLKAEGQAMPVATIFSPIPTTAFSAKEIKNFKDGNFSPSGQIAKLAFAHTQDFLHGPRSETQLDRLHFYGPSLGANNAIGSAAAMLVRDSIRQVASVTAQELILGPKSRRDLLKRFTIAATVGDASTERMSKHAPRIPETAMRRDLDDHGNELAVATRMARGIMKLSYLKGLTQPKHTIDDIDTMTGSGIPVTVAIAENSGLTEHTEEHLADIVRNKYLVRVRGVEGAKADHLLDEHVAASATIALMGVSKSIRKR